MYKNKDKQREANRKAQAKFKAKLKAEGIEFSEKKNGTFHIPLTKGITKQGITDKVLPQRLEHEQYYHQAHCNAPSHVKQFAKGVSCSCRKPERTAQGNIRVSKPGDADYEPMCETTRAFVDGRDKRPSTAKRGKDIKCFSDLPPDVQATINRVSESNEEKQKRTAAAIKYQHLFPERYHSTGVAI